MEYDTKSIVKRSPLLIAGLIAISIAAFPTLSKAQVVTRATILASGGETIEFDGVTSRSTVGQTPIGSAASLEGFDLKAGFWYIASGETGGPVADVVAFSDSATTTLGASVSIDVTANDVNPIEGPLTVVSVTQPVNGAAAVIGETLVEYTPNPTFLGEDAFTYRVTNELGASGEALVYVRVEMAENGPAFLSAPRLFAGVDILYRYEVEAATPVGEVGFDAPDLPEWLELAETSDTTALLEGTPATSDLGSHAVAILASNLDASSVQSFTITVVNQVPEIPELVSPADGENLDDSRVEWEWHPSERAEFYRFQLARDVDFTQFNSDVIGISRTTWRITLSDPGTYYWRIGADNPVGFSGFSEVRTFIIGSPVSVESEDELPREFELDQNYPNPFNPTTSIVYHLPKSTHVRLAVYDVFGKLVRLLVDEEKPAGSYSATFVAGDIASGSYVYRIQAGGWTKSRTMILLK